MSLLLTVLAHLVWYSFLVVAGAGIVLLLLTPIVLAFKLVVTALVIVHHFIVGILSLITLPLTWLLRLRNRNVRSFYRRYRDLGGAAGPGESARQADRGDTAVPSPQPGDLDPYQILGVSRGASKEALSRAYREKMQMNHPDKVAALDPALQELATVRTQMIGQAYRQILGA